MKGKEKCRALREIRKKIAEQNEIAYVVSECRHQGDCRGTCPKCESELRYLETQLKIRENLGKAIAITGLAITIPALTACDFSMDYGNESLEGSTAFSPEPEYSYDESERSPMESDTESLPEIVGEIEESVPDSSEFVGEEDFGNDLEGDIEIVVPLQ